MESIQERDNVSTRRDGDYAGQSIKISLEESLLTTAQCAWEDGGAFGFRRADVDKERRVMTGKAAHSSRTDGLPRLTWASSKSSGALMLRMGLCV